MFTLFLTLLSLFVAAYLFYAPVPPGWLPALEILLLLLLGAIFLILSLTLLRLRAERLSRERPLAVPVATETGEAPVRPDDTAAAEETAVVQFLARLQEKGRLVDFLQEDIAPYGDEQVGAAARVVHQGCREVLAEAFALKPVHGGDEGEEITLAGDYDAGSYRLTGKVPDRAPFRGTVRHRGWRTGRVRLPKVTGSAAAVREIVAPAEVEIQ